MPKHGRVVGRLDVGQEKKKRNILGRNRDGPLKMIIAQPPKIHIYLRD